MKAEIKSINDRPTLLIDGKTVPPVLYALNHAPCSKTNTVFAQKNIANFGQRGVNLVSVDAELCTYWRKGMPFDGASILAEVGHAVMANPEAKVLIRLHIDPPYWWLRDNPNEQFKSAQIETVDHGEPPYVVGNTDSNSMQVSFASDKWLKDTSEILKAFCDFAKDKPETDSIMGIQVACGIYGEWHYWMFGAAPDYGEPMQKRFRAFAKEKYRTIQELNKAWKGEYRSFEEISVPDSSRRFEVTDSYFRDPVSDRDVSDSLECLQQTVPEAIVTFCKVIKDNWKNQILTGAFYGYYFATFGELAETGGHLQIEYIYKNRKYIDFLCAPMCYFANRTVDGMFFPRGMVDSERLNGMLFITEMDEAPYETGYWDFKRCSRITPEVHDKKELLKFEKISEFCLRRHIIGNLTKGQGVWYFDHSVSTYEPVRREFYKDGWWEKTRYLKQVGKLQSVYDKYCGVKYESDADVLLIYDTKVYYSLKRTPFCLDDVEYAFHKKLAYSAVGYEEIYIGDVDKVDLSRYKCIFFMNTYLIDSETKGIINRIVEKTSADIVWVYAPGYSDAKSLSVKNIENITGFQINRTSDEEGYTCTVEGKEEYVKCTQKLVEAFSASGDGCEVFGKFDSGCNAIVRRKEKGRNVWYLSCYDLAQSLMKKIFSEAKAHFYIDNVDNYVMVGGGIVVICSKKGGKERVTLKNNTVAELKLKKLSVVIIDSISGEIIDE